MKFEGMFDLEGNLLISTEDGRTFFIDSWTVAATELREVLEINGH